MAHPPIVIYDAAGRAVSRSKNLAGIIRHANGRLVDTINVSPDAVLSIRWSDGTHVDAPFADASVAVHWAKSRAWFKGVPVTRKNGTRARKVKDLADDIPWKYHSRVVSGAGFVASDNLAPWETADIVAALQAAGHVVSVEENAVAARGMRAHKTVIRASKGRANPAFGDYIAAGRRHLATGLTRAAEEAQRAAERARVAAEREARRRKCDAPTPEQAIRVLAQAIGVEKLNPRRNPHDSRGRYHGEVKGTAPGRVAKIHQYVEGGDYHVLFVLVHRDGEEQVVSSPRTAYKTLAAAERKARTFVDDAPRKNGARTAKRIVDVKETHYGFSTRYLVTYADGSTETVFHASKEFEPFLSRKNGRARKNGGSVVQAVYSPMNAAWILFHSRGSGRPLGVFTTKRELVDHLRERGLALKDNGDVVTAESVGAHRNPGVTVFDLHRM